MIEIKDLYFDYKWKGETIRALDGVNLQIDKGESVAIIGANGSGKTTLARCINGLLRPTSGEVKVDGLSTKRSEDIWQIRRKVGMIFQNPDDQTVSATVEREVAFGLENLGMLPSVMRSRVEEILARFDLEGYRFHHPHRLSGGEKQRLAIASVLAMFPEYLILDEPTSLLDPMGRREMIQILKELHTEDGVTTVHITQYPQEALQAYRLIVMAEGRVVMDDTPAGIFSNPDPLRGLGLEGPGAPSWMPIQQGREIVAMSDVKRERSSKIATGGLSYVYDRGMPTERKALTNVDLEIKEEMLLALIGPTGSGKTTLVQHFNGLLRPTTGWVEVDGQRLWQKGIDLKKVRRKIGLAFQFPEFQLFEESIFKDVAFGLRNLGVPEERIDQRVNWALNLVGLTPEKFGSRSPLTLSEGEKRRAAIAGVVAMRPEVLILDEPTVGLDPEGVKCIVDILIRLNSGGTTVIIISHDMDLVARLCGEIIVLDEGRVIKVGTPEGVFSQPEVLRSMRLDLPGADENAINQSPAVETHPVKER